MAEQKIFAGPASGHPQPEAHDADRDGRGLGISPSYLNLIERNQRPLTVQLILKLASVYGVDPRELQAEAHGSVAALKEVFSDPLLAGELPGDQEMVELAEAAPNAAAAVIKLFRAYREQAERLSDLNQLLARAGLATDAFVHPSAVRRGARWRSSGGPTTSPRSRPRPRPFLSFSNPVTASGPPFMHG